jgi:DNA-binding FadR family transcriptional regulator
MALNEAHREALRALAQRRTVAASRGATTCLNRMRERRIKRRLDA